MLDVACNACCAHALPESHVAMHDVPALILTLCATFQALENEVVGMHHLNACVCKRQ
jgi:hypothetical protein